VIAFDLGSDLGSGPASGQNLAEISHPADQVYSLVAQYPWADLLLVLVQDRDAHVCPSFLSVLLPVRVIHPVSPSALSCHSYLELGWGSSLRLGYLEPVRAGHIVGE
jgi:hypothetical protein